MSFLRRDATRTSRTEIAKPKQANPFESPKDSAGEPTFYPSLDEIPDPRSKLSRRKQKKLGELVEEILFEPHLLLEGPQLKKVNSPHSKLWGIRLAS